MLDANALSSLKRTEIFVCKPPKKDMRATFYRYAYCIYVHVCHIRLVVMYFFFFPYRNMLPDIAIAVSQPSRRFFHLEDFEFAYLSNGSCPYSRVKDVGEYGSL